MAVSSPLLEAAIDGATGILLNITAGSDIGLFEVNEAAEVVTSAADQNANVIFGAVIDDSLGDQVRVTVIATGFGPKKGRPRREAAREPYGRGADRPSSERSQGAASSTSFDVPPDVLEIPSFLRDN
jgi:cell division protein FtsZ